MQGNFAEGYVDSDLVAAIPVSATPAHQPLVVGSRPNTESQKRYYRSVALLASVALVILTVAAVGVLVANRLNRPIDELKGGPTRARAARSAARSDWDRGARFAALGAGRQPQPDRGAAGA